MKSQHTQPFLNTGKIMNKSIGKLFLALVVGSTLFSCGEKKQDAMVAPQGMHVVDLSRFGKPFAIFVPDTVAARLTITEQNTGALEIKVGKTFAISINEQASDLELKKSDIKGDEVNKFTSFIKEEPTAILWESAITKPEFHFIVNQKIGNSEYSLEDLVSEDASPYSKEAIQKMFDSAKSIKEVKHEPKS